MDDIDRAQELETAQREAAIRAATVRKPTGAASCEVCGASISELRQSYGARMCIPHATAAEAHERLLRGAV